MVKLEMSKELGRKTRKDDPVDLGIPNFDVLAQAIKAGKTQEALEFLEYVREGNRRNNDSLAAYAEGVLSHLATFGEEQVEKILRERYTGMAKEFLTGTHRVEDYLQRSTETQRFHHGEFTVKEEPDRYVLTYNPCGTGGRMKRTRSMGTTKKAYPWSWNRVGVPYYCCHCCLRWEIIPIELIGHQIRINIPGEKPEDPCVHLFYKKPELIPEEFFARVGKKKDLSKMKKK